MIHEVNAKSILRKAKKIDSWFLSSYSINLYRGCTHNCVYCDGRHEKYQVDGNYGKDVEVKINAPDLLDRELDPARKRKPFNGGFMVVCGGVSDSYQPIELKYGITRSTLKLLLQYGHPVHIVTKSSLIEKDIELLQQINSKTKALVSFSFSSVSDQLSRGVEPGATPPSKRLETMKKLKSAGISCGMFLMPVIPFLSDSPQRIEESIAAAKNAGADYVVFGGMTLKDGRQKEYFYRFLDRYFPELRHQYEIIYPGYDKWGSPDYRYSESLNNLFCEIAEYYKMPKRIPAEIIKPLVSINQYTAVVLEQLDYLARLKGQNSPYGKAARAILKEEESVENWRVTDFKRLPGVGEFCARVMYDTVRSGESEFYHKML